MVKLKLGLCLILMMLTAACASTTSPAVPPDATAGDLPGQVVKISVCHQITSTSNLPLLYAKEKGIFKKYGLEVDLTSIESGSKVATAMIAGEFPICQVGGVSITNAVVAGEDLVYIAEYFNRYVMQLMVAPEIKTGADLKGKVMVISEPGSVVDAAMRAALISLDLEPDKDVVLITSGSNTNRMAALESGQAFGSMFPPPQTLILKDKGYHSLVDLTTLDEAFPYCGIATSRSYLSTHREVVTNFMKAILESIAGFLSDPQGSKAILAEHLALDETSDAALLEEAYQNHFARIVRQKPYPTLEGIQTVLNQIKANNTVAEKIRPEDVIDPSIMKELDESGFIDALYSLK